MMESANRIKAIIDRQIMLLGGEFLNRKKPNVFSLGITSGGIAVLYAALATSYFGLELIGSYPAIGICILITAVDICSLLSLSIC